MIQLELYIKEITRFLRTVTIKNDYFKDQMEETYATDAFIGKYPNNLHPYYRHLLGQPTYESFDEFRSLANIDDEVTDAQLAFNYNFDYVKVDCVDDNDIGPKEEFTTINGIMIKLKSDTVVVYDSISKTNNRYRIYPNCVYYYNQICPVRVLYKKFDDLMVINSIDTKEIIPFNSSIFKSKKHQKTASLYRMPSRYYSKICEKYPNNVDLIKAIVYPIQLDTAVETKNYGLINCDLSQLRENERASMYMCLIDTLAMIQTRWDVREFVYEDLYALSIQAKIWDTLILALMKQRIKNIRTSAAHEYHIWKYLESHGISDYSDVLSLKQAIFLYRNFPYLLRHRGTDFNLVLLAHKLLSDWNITITGKNVLQLTSNPYVSDDNNDVNIFEDSCTTTPVIDSVVVGETVLKTLRTIDKNDESYLNKTEKAKDELNSFDYHLNSLQQNHAGTIENINKIYKEEQDVGLEYKNEYLFDKSTSSQTRQFERTPHTSTVTKLLKISKLFESTLFKQIYARFMTESLLYRTATEDTDYIVLLTHEDVEYSIELTIKQAIALVIYCTLKELDLFKENTKLNSSIHLTVPYKKEFSNIPNKFIWNNESVYTTEALKVIPYYLEVVSSDLPSECIGTYELINPDVDKKYWIWKNDHDVTIGLDPLDVNNRWKMSIGDIDIYSDYQYPYQNWRKRVFTWYHEEKYLYSEIYLSTKSIEIKDTTGDFFYLIDELMPNNTTSTYDELINLLHNQAIGYIEIYRELHNSDLARQHACVTDIIKSRTVNEIVNIDFLDGLTFDEFILQNINIKELLDKIESNSYETTKVKFAQLANAIVKILFPIDSLYLEDNSGVVFNRFKRIKELFVSLCSYNVAYLEESISTLESCFVATSFVTQDYDYGISTFESNYFIDSTALLSLHHVIPDSITDCYVNIYSYIETECIHTPIYIGDTTDTQYVEDKTFVMTTSDKLRNRIVTSYHNDIKTYTSIE